MSERDEHSRRRGLDPATLLFGIAALLVSATALTDGTGWLPDLDPRLLLAGGAVLVGVLLMAGALRRPSRAVRDGSTEHR